MMIILMRRNIHSLVSSARAVFVVLEKREFRRREKEGEKAPPRYDEDEKSHARRVRREREE
jgi:hypothetical protein